MPKQELQQLLTSLQQEMRTRQDASMGSVHDVSSVLQTIFKEGALRTNVPKLSAFSREEGKERCHLTSGVMNSKHSGSPIVTWL